jgi:predicted DNA-binding transcriptional regulator AlpA
MRQDATLTDMSDKPRTYLTATQVRARYGGRSSMWLWRKLKHDPSFPRPLVMGRSTRLFSVDELDAYDDSLRDQKAAG